MKLPRRWTDVDGADSSDDLCGDAIFTVESLREFGALLEALARRRAELSEVRERAVR